MSYLPGSAGTPTDDAAGDRFAEAVTTYRRRWLRAAHALTGDRHSAEDLLQTVLAASLTRLAPLADAGAADAYVRRSLRNQHVSWWRQAVRRAESLVAEMPEPDPLLTDDERLVQREELWALVKRLPPAQRSALVLRFYEDLTEAQTARALGCSTGTVKSNTSRALRALRSELVR